MNVSEIIASITDAIKNTSVTEWSIFITALLYVILAAFENIWCWLFGILSSALSVYLCYTGHLFLESGLSIFYVVIGIYGWYQWLYGNKEKKELAISKTTAKQLIVFIFISCAIWIPFGIVAYKFSTQALPFLDAFITAFSIVATYMTAKKILENWLFWVLIDGLAIVLYASRGFYLMALLYLIYTILAAAGYFSWKRKTTP